MKAAVLLHLAIFLAVSFMRCLVFIIRVTFGIRSSITWSSSTSSCSSTDQYMKKHFFFCWMGLHLLVHLKVWHRGLHLNIQKDRRPPPPSAASSSTGSFSLPLSSATSFCQQKGSLPRNESFGYFSSLKADFSSRVIILVYPTASLLPLTISSILWT
jgi:hypothetical protein